MIRKFLVSIAALLALLTVAVAVVPAQAASDVLTVNTTADTDDGSCNARGKGKGNKDCTLREAINASNASHGVRETIKFAILAGGGYGQCTPGGFECVIAPVDPLPDLKDPVTLDGYSQSSGASTSIASPNTLQVGDDAKLRITLRWTHGSNMAAGLRLMGGGSTVKGLTIQGFSVGGLFIQSDHNVVEGNFIGVNQTGSYAMPNGVGIMVQGKGNRIGGSSPAARNLISGNSYDGINVSDSGGGNKILGNYIGTNPAGKLALANRLGITLTDTQGITVGGKGKSRNVIAGNAKGDVYIAGLVHDSKIIGNYIAVTAAGGTAFNDAWEVVIDGCKGGLAHDLLISKNLISNGAGPAVAIGCYPTDHIERITLSQNTIYGAGAEIDLGSDGATANDSKDTDSGVNALQNYPTLASAVRQDGALTVKGTLNSRKRSEYQLEFFGAPKCDASNGGDSAIYLGSVHVTTNAKGKAPFTFTKSKKISQAFALIATATEIVDGKLGGTSEFSHCVAVTVQ